MSKSFDKNPSLAHFIQISFARVVLPIPRKLTNFTALLRIINYLGFPL